ncbi:MAG: hypothetical protein AB7T74_13490 [Clostridia bacterium]|jgi:hypothetical protein|nr:hypothetical protein [Spirochaetia bacterium]
MDHPKTVEWDARMKSMFDRIDAILEDRYHNHWRLRRNRPGRGETTNPEADGLFNVGAIFTPGYGSEIGRGYLVDITLATDAQVPQEQREEIEALVLDLLKGFIPEYFPERRLEVSRDGSMYKIHGDLSLGSV